ncbi:MAG: carboxylate-amine ligase, partial [Myxococcota bacterium]
MKDAFTLGIEQEFQIIDPNTRELRSAISQMMEANELLSEMSDIEFQRELHQSVVEVASGICANIQEARADVVRDRAAA